MLKSALKTASDSDSMHERRKVSFCKTVEVYGYPSISSLENDDRLLCDDFQSSVILVENPVDTKEIGVEDFSVEEPEDYLVHKVVYGDFEEISPSGSLQDLREEPVETDTIVYYPYEPENELQEFVVHCVNMLEERKDGKTCASGTESKKEKLCELSIENIEHHNKITESKILGSGTFSDSDIVLSPPLQNLGIEHLISAQSEEWLWTLDISPLNSVHETDSGSNISSEDTMIMMTSSECQKNEQRIQESLQKFECLKRRKSVDEFSAPLSDDLISGSNNKCQNVQPDLVRDLQIKKSVSVKLPTENISVGDSCQKKENSPHAGNIALKSGPFSLETKVNIPERTLSLEHITGELPTPEDGSTFNSVTNPITIPRDVREWRIEFSGNQSFVETSLSNFDCNDNDRCNSLDLDGLNLGDGSDDHQLDELESFADQSNERIERIKKRYSISETSNWTPRRGIRPRFGSTAQILQQMQNETTPNVLNHHYSWPYYSPSSNESESSSLSNSRTDLIQNVSGNFSPGDSNRVDTTILVQSETCSEDLLTCEERGAPEGSSSSLTPQISSEISSESKNQIDTRQFARDNVIYYTMKI